MELRRKGKNVLEAAFDIASALGWSKEEFMLAAQDVSEAENIPLLDSSVAESSQSTSFQPLPRGGDFRVG